MVTPITLEAEWAPLFAELPRWQPPLVKTLVVSPHPDDETLGAGGLICALIKAGVEVSVVSVTDGENAYAGEVGLGAVRQKEQSLALEELGLGTVTICRLHQVDSGLKECEAELTKALMEIASPGMHIVAPWTGDFHPDHEVCGRVAREVARAVGAKLTFYFFWTWHRGTPATLDGLELVAFPLQPDEVERKKAALQCHRSQLTHVSGEPILPPYLLGSMERDYEVFLPA